MRRLTTSAESCVFDKQSLGPIYCDRPRLKERVLSPKPAPLLPKLRGNFAEFLNHSSPDRLGMLYPPTCVGFGTGSNRLPRGFSWKYGLTHFTQLLRPTPQLMRSAFYNFSTYVLSRGRPEPRRATLLRHPIGIAPIWRDRNIYLLCIDYAFRPRLSSRLTLGGLALPRNP